MRKALAIAAIGLTLALPAAAFAQPAPPSPSPELRSMMEKVHAEARTAAYAALTPAHAASVTALTSQVAAGTLDRRAAEKQIDTLLTSDERKAVMAAGLKSRHVMFEAMAAAGGGPMGGLPPGGPPPGGPGMGGSPPGSSGNPGMAGPASGTMGEEPGGPPGGPGGRRGFGRRSAGRYLIMVSMTPDQMRKLMPRARRSSAP